MLHSRSPFGTQSGMTVLESRRRDEGVGAVAPAFVIAALFKSSGSVVADALRDASFVVAQASTLEEICRAIVSVPCAILLLEHPVDRQIAEWIESCRKQPAQMLPPILLLCDPDRLQEALATQLSDFAIASDAPRGTLLQSVRMLARLASAEQLNRASSATLPLANRAESIWQPIIQALPFGLLIVNDSGTIVDGNRAAADLLATPTDRLIGAHSSDLLGDTGIQPSLQDASTGGSWTAGNFVRTRNDEILELEYLARSGVLPGIQVVVLQDATARNRREALQQRAEKMDSLARLVGGMAHEFNNLLTVILGYSDLSVRLAPADSRFSDALAQIKNSAERGAHLTQLLLAFGRKQVMAPAWVDLNHLLVDLEEHIRKIVGEGIEVNVQLAPTVPLVFVDPMLVQRALVQIVANARDAMPKNGILSLSTDEFEVTGVFAQHKPELQPGRYVCLSVHDNGPGIPSDVKPFIFEPFFTTKSVGQGTGLGLAFVDGVMHQSGGSVDVSSEPGQGATVRLFFSTVGPWPGARPVSAPVGTIARTNATVLLVDDDEGVRKFGSLVLRGQGYQVLEARDGAEALALVAQNPAKFDLVVTDVIMPAMGGVELGNRLGVLQPGLPVLYQSGRLEDMTQAEGGLERNLHFLTKPFSREAFLAKVSELVKRPAS